MNDKEWEQFFELLEKIVNLPLPVKEKIALVKQKCQDDINLEEFLAWDFGYDN